jgi:hypothetical protein
MLSLAGCNSAGDTKEYITVTTNDSTYRFDESSVKQHYSREDGNSFDFVRIALRAWDAVLEHSRLNYSSINDGGALPVVAHVSAGALPKTLKMQTVENQKVVCIKGGEIMIYSCGIALEHGGLRWSIRFSETDVPNAPLIARDGIHALDRAMQKQVAK